jgi:UDP-glucose 4-epimerase
VGRTSPSQDENFFRMSLDKSSDFSEILSDIDVVVHAAARAHVMEEKCKNPLEEYRNINTFLTLNLAEQAARKGVKRFIFISSIKVLGEKTEPGRLFSSNDPFNPQDPYGVSKVEAEIGLQKIAKRTNMELVVIRPPLVYGRGVKGNFAKLLKLTALPIPLPLGSLNNKRSLVGIENLVDLICICLEHQKAKNQIFLVSDDLDLSTPALLTLMSRSGRHKCRLFKFPPSLLLFMLKCLGKGAIYNRLCGSMQVDITHTKNQLDWKPSFSPEDCIVNCWSD